MADESPDPDAFWQSADARRDEWRNHLAADDEARRNRTTAGDGLGMNGHSVELLDTSGAEGGGFGEATGAIQLIINFDGTLRWVSVPLLGIQDV